MISFLDRYWYLLVVIGIGIAAAVIVFGPMLAARVSTRIAPRQYMARAANAALVIGLIAGAMAVPLLDPDTLTFSVIGLVFLGALFGWVLMFENDAMQFSGWFSFWGPVRPIPERMAVPVRHSWSLTVLFLVVGLMAGACIRILTTSA